MIEQRFFEFLHERIGLDVASVGETMIQRALRQRCDALGLSGFDAYWSCLQQSPQEQQALIEAVIVPETWFFRYPESFNALATLARTRLAARHDSHPLRILSLPCSTGEEPYSIAMALLDAGLPGSAFRIDAMDISPDSIAKAERGVYGRNAFRGSDLGFRDRYFQGEADGHRLDERVRRQVDLRPGNLLDPRLQARAGHYDVVFCRNLLIYFDTPTQQRAFEVLTLMTQPDGVLFIGPAEGSLLARLGMRPLGVAQSFAYVRQTPGYPLPPPTTRTPASRPRAFSAPLANRPLVAATRPLRPMTPAPAPGIAPVRRDSEAELLAQIRAQANAGASDEARRTCQRYLQQFEPRAQVYYWLGLLSDTAGDTRQAQQLYRKALYLEPQHAEALAQLAALLTASGDAPGAQRLLARAARARGEAE
ncbi:MAG: chemotaxis protein CheR [Pseudomonas sp.]|jgi:chemotaxis protein methyltransferase WspC|uniref:CheR family methyltransferase n=1 Tax=Pseudomonas entomophila TaxID=312306 RepID=UPI0015E36146|nr:CheR family methyltransferase [Pseudomonas entomophila]MBA1193222.1 chemotaxis protein CheR [Pseudomonas entomophila]MDF2490507.1 chemotaxis protein CheR [Pseudomonas sp.]